MQQDEIQVGDRVRSFDFPQTQGTDPPLTGRNACYLEGVVEAILPAGVSAPETGMVFPDCPRYVIRVTRQVFRGEDRDRDVGSLAFPPVNGVTTLVWDRPTFGVLKIDPETEPGAREG